MTKAQEKKIASVYEDMKAEDIGDIWKIFKDKVLDKDELAKFDILRAVYKDKTGNSLAKNTHNEKGKK